jgi:hypothetical protein
MRIREVTFEGPEGLAEPVRYEIAPGLAVVGPGEPLVGWISGLLFGSAEGPAWEGRLRAEIEEDGDRRVIERALGPMEEAPPLLDPSQAPLRILRRNPRPVVVGEEERKRLQALLPQLEAELAAQDEMERLDAELRALQHEIFLVEGRIEQVERARAAERKAQERAAPYRAVELPEDLDARIAAFEQARARRDEKEARFRKELDTVARTEAESRLELRKDLRLWGSLAVGILALALGLFTPWKGLAILSIPAFGICAAILLGAISTLEQREEAIRQRLFLEDRLSELARTFAEESRGVEEIFAATGVGSLEEFRAWLAAARQAEEELRLATEARTALEAREETRLAAETKARLSQEIDAREKKLASLSAGAFRSPGEIQSEIAEIRSRLGEEKQRTDDSAALLDAAVACAGCDRATLLKTLGKRASQLLVALTEGRWKSVGWGGSGGLALKGESGVSRYTELDHEDREAARAALAFAVTEAVGGPLVLDGPFDELAPELQSRLAKALQWLAGRGVQIVHRTEVAAFRKAAAVVEAA